MIPFSPLILTKALTEGFTSLSTLMLHKNKEITAVLEKFLRTQSDYDMNSTHDFFLRDFDDRKAALAELLALADTGSPDYKRFLFVIQQLWNYMNPRLNPLFHEDGTYKKGISAFLATTGMLKLPMQHKDWPFRVGENLATTPGYVIFENEIIQLLHFPSKNKTKKDKPVFIVSPWINKYYIFDLSTHNSFISWLTTQNISVYCISWVNPDHTFSDQSFTDYVLKGIHEGAQKALIHSKARQLNLVGYCVGGVALTVYAGWLAQQKSTTMASLTFLATPFDFEKLDNLRLFISEDQLAHIEQTRTCDGIFSGDKILQTFTLIRSNDLLMQGIIDQIYYDKMPKPLDFLYWNADITNLPGRMHVEYLRAIFLKNAFLEKPKKLLGLDIDLEAITCPVYVVATKKDHIVPWHASYTAFELFSDVTFCLGGSGHVAGIMNPPHLKKYDYHVNEARTQNPNDWFAQSTTHVGSWWTHWLEWVRPNLGKNRVNKEVCADDVIEMAPGRYALQDAPEIRKSSL